MNNTIPEIIEKLLDIRKCAIFCHARPDGDALGSALALQRQLRALGKEADMIVESEVPDKFFFMPVMKEVLNEIPAGKYDAFISVDSADVKRIGKFADAYTRFRGTTINIDHHISNPGYAKYNYVQECCACCDILTDIFREAGWEPDIVTANLLMLGLITDSGNFTHSDVTEKTYIDAGYLRACGADPHEINYNMYDRQVKERALLHGRVMSQMKFFCEDRVAVIVIRNQDMDELGAKRSITEGYVDFPLSVDTVEVAISMLQQEDPNDYKVSFRSKGRANVNEVAVSFKGGGHVLASGCEIFGTEEQCIRRLIDAVSKVL
ncbi:MAG: bifunctional oligoribonuclease/PAP phosphatase NrnA [Clostridia bacterium]|nr:bifunctional oligoribonuclease/PAP phosphatase NrnA [Clostridia bacterium]